MRSVACDYCSRSKKRCIFPTTESQRCLLCERRSLTCSGQRQAPPSEAAFRRKFAPVVKTIISPSSLDWTLNTRQLGYSLTHHLITLHIQHRPPRVFGGTLEHEWDSIGAISGGVNGKADELSPVVQSLLALGLADGARLSTHSAIIGGFTSPLPQFGSFSSVDNRLVTLGSRRRDAVDCLNEKAMDCMDSALLNSDEMNPEIKLKLLWIGLAAGVETPQSRAWCRRTSLYCAQYIIESFEKEEAGDRTAMYEFGFYVVMTEAVRSICTGVSFPLTMRDYVTVMPDASLPADPLYYAQPSEYELILQHSTSPNIMESAYAFIGRLFGGRRRYYVKIILVLLYGEPALDLLNLVSTMWDWVDGTCLFVDTMFRNLAADPRFKEIRQSRGSPCWTSWGPFQALMKHLFISENIYFNILMGCHFRLVESLGLGPLRAKLVAASQKRLYMTLRRLDFVCGLRDPVADYREFDPILRAVRLISAGPENGPCGTFSLRDFPNLLETFEFMAFSNTECSDFLLRRGYQRSGKAGDDSQRFADGTSVSDLPPLGTTRPLNEGPLLFKVDALVSMLLSPSTARRVKKQEGIAEELVKAALNAVLETDDTASSPLSTDEGDLSWMLLWPCAVESNDKEPSAWEMVDSTLRRLSDSEAASDNSELAGKMVVKTLSELG